MEKLIELLNEYKWWRKFEYEDRSNVFYRWCFDDYEQIKDCELISKKLWFISRLVENNKISPFEIDRKIIDSWWLYHWKETTINRVWNNLDKVLLMLLSISDNPIQDLILYLK